MSERSLKTNLNAANAEAQQYLNELAIVRKENEELRFLARTLQHQLALVRLVLKPVYAIPGSEG